MKHIVTLMALSYRVTTDIVSAFSSRMFGLKASAAYYGLAHDFMTSENIGELLKAAKGLHDAMKEANKDIEACQERVEALIKDDKELKAVEQMFKQFEF